MSEQISQRQLRNESGRIVRALAAGESFVISRNGRPVGMLMPVSKRRSIAATEAVAAYKGWPRVDFAALRRDLDAVSDGDR